MASNRLVIPLSRRVAIVAALAAFAAASGAQPRGAGKARLGILSASTPDPITMRAQIEPLRRGLRELGHVEGRNLSIDMRWAEGKFDRLPALLDELLRLDIDILMTTSPRPALLAKEKVKTLPVIAVGVDDPVKSGLVADHIRPGGNITGISAAFDGLMQKRLQLLKDVLPTARRFAIVFNPNTVPPEELARGVARWEPAIGVALQVEKVRGPDDFEPAFASIVGAGTNAVSLVADPMIWTERTQLGALCTKHRLPSVWGGAAYLDAGGLLSYQGDWSALFYRAASFVDKILKGTRPGDIPFEQGTKLELAVNLKAAKALGLTIPHSVLVSADQVIE
ncbi:ABC transporter substrate-binding protein [Variovorax sp. DT-64]|uniref:ABC transporter substrate-binding protein n=1 Tax=Variovorax sp. DT-64 TaxID=3396160 RepID=UPI003F1A7F0C